VRVRIDVPGLPPKKDGANSMWGKSVEKPRIVCLRRALRDQLGDNLFKREVSLELELRIPDKDLFRIGDLDNFVSGGCDAMMAANGSYWRSHTHSEPEWRGIQPNEAIALEDDSKIISIVARKIRVSDQTPSSYCLILDDNAGQ
jgi:hypothetical protein